MARLPKFSKKTKRILLLLLIVAAVITASLTAMERERLSPLERGLRDLFAPVKNGALLVYDKFAQIPKFFSERNELLEENQALREENSRLNAELVRLEELGLENVQLRELLALADQMAEWQPVSANVIGRSHERWYRTITISGGENKGFSPGLPVINAEGLVGRILSVSRYTSEVLLITDREGAVGAMVQLSRVAGVVEAETGNDDTLFMIHIPGDVEIKENQVVITSGLGDLYPHGLRIGYISAFSFDNGGLSQRAQITPFVDFDRLENVLVLTEQPLRELDLTPPTAEDGAEEDGDG